MSVKSLVFIKLGGSLITDKSKPYTARINIINQLAADFKEVVTQSKDMHFIIGNGAGSYGHYAATIQDKNTPYGFAFIQQKVKELNVLLTSALLKQSIPCVSIHMSSIAVSKNGKLNTLYLDSIHEALGMRLIPSVYGDVVLDNKLRSHIFSTEDIFSCLIIGLQKMYTEIVVIHLTTVAGFMENNGRVISEVTKKNYPELKKNLIKTKGYDVTGGMKHKIEESLRLAGMGINTYIASGKDPQILQKILLKKEQVGTKVIT